MAQKYEQHIENFEEFFKSRLNFVIESSLNHIELKVFLDRLVGHDENIKFAELGEMIRTIFSEVSSESLVLFNANRTARKQINAAFEYCGLDKTTGILFRYRQCNKCNKFLDEDIKDKKLQAIMSNYSLITSQKVEGGVDDQHYAQVENMGDYLKGLDVLELDTGKYEDEPEDNDQSLKRKAQQANWSDWWDIKKKQNVKLQ